MAIIKGILLEEYKRLNNTKQAYLNKINALPKGSIRTKKIGNKFYHYLKYRKGYKTITDYIKDQSKIKILSFKIKQRKKYENIVKEIEKDLKLLGKLKRNEPTAKRILGNHKRLSKK